MQCSSIKSCIFDEVEFESMDTLQKNEMYAKYYSSAKKEKKTENDKIVNKLKWI